MNASERRVRQIWFALGLGLCAVFIYGCLMPNPPSEPGVPYFDKLEHGSAFVAMGFWFGALYWRRPWHVLIALSVFAAGTEVMQWASGYRDGNWPDWLADTVGIMLGLAVLRLIGVDWVAQARRFV